MPDVRSEQLPEVYEGPGLVDLQVNGCAGFDFNASPESWSIGDFRRVQQALARRGIVAALPTFITDDADLIIARARRYASFVEADADLECTFPKLHIEGPFISPDDGPRGAHPLAHCTTPDGAPDFLARLIEASGNRIGILTLAPELPGAIELIARATACGVCVALGHTQASAETIRQAVEAGAILSTHLGNGSHRMLPRSENYIQVQLAEDRLFASFIADGHHVPMYALKNFIRAKTPDRSILVSDSIAGAAVGPGLYRVGMQEVVVSADLRAHKPGQPNLAGSALTLDKAVVNVAAHCGVSFRQAWEMASTTPARLVGLDPPPDLRVRVSADGLSLE